MKTPLGNSPYSKYGKKPYRYSELCRRLSEMAKSGDYDSPEAKELKLRHRNLMGIHPAGHRDWPEWSYA